MTTVNTTSTAATSAAKTSGKAPAKAGFSGMGTADFIKLMTTQMQQQDPFNPMDNKDMLAQMAQFSALSATTDMGTTLKDIAAKLDAVLAAQQAAKTTSTPTNDNTAATGA